MRFIQFVYKNMGTLPMAVLHVFFFLAFCSVSILNHYFFRSAALDYGIANQALYQFAHLQNPVCTLLLQNTDAPYLSLHMSLWVPLLSPLYWIFGSYTLLWVQNIALIFCGVGIYKVAAEELQNKSFAFLITLQFYISFAVYAALASDFHENVLGACFFPWLYYYYSHGKKWQTFLCVLAMLISKENFAIWLPFVIVGLVFVNKQWNYKQWLFPLGLILLCASWFILVGLWIMPALSPVGKFEQLTRFSHLGGNIEEIISTIISKPLDMFNLFYKSNVQPDSDELIKQELLWVLLFSGGIALLWRPSFLLMILPLLMQKLWNKEVAFWGINYHYNIEFAPVIAIAIVMMLASIKQVQIKSSLLVFCLLGTLYMTVSKMQERIAYHYNPINENVFSSTHYSSQLPVVIIKKGLNQIPQNASVSAHANLAPHIANRDTIYHFPFIKNARYIALLFPTNNTYPLSPATYNHIVDSLKQSRHWKIEYYEEPILIMKRNDWISHP
ncbi:MAG: DUF2079 domain-containing protein [Bacteroidota bacterium]|nr:DUF2079 domain-containing protein [Bacteroidota bacterium]